MPSLVNSGQSPDGRRWAANKPDEKFSFFIAVFILFMIPKQTGKKAEGRTRDRFDMADPEDEISMADRFHGPDLFEFSKKDTGGNQSHES
jgi:hypothetical protein